ncbi:hypothetical protein ACWGOQ_0008415 [Aquimarina sp. M1]
MKLSKKIAYASTALILILLMYVVANKWATYQIEKELMKLSDNEVSIAYESVDVQLINRKVRLQEVLIRNQKNNKLFVETVSLSGIEIIKLLIDNEIHASHLTIIKPSVTKIDTAKEKETKKRDSSSSKQFLVAIENVSVKQGTVVFKKSTDDQNNYFSISNFSLEIKDVRLSDTTMNQTIPFAFTSQVSEFKGINYRLNEFHTFSIPVLISNNEKIELHNFQINPTMSKSEFLKSIAREQDYMKLQGKHLVINSPKITTLPTGQTVLKVNELKLDSISFDVYRDKRLADDTSPKPMYSKLIRDISTGFIIDSTRIQRSYIRYEEHPDNEKNPGLLEFHEVKAQISAISNLPGTSKVDAHISAMYMKQAPMQLHWSFDVQDTSDTFLIEGSVKKIQAESMNSFLVPVTDVRAVGVIDELYYTYQGNAIEASGAMKMRFDTFELKAASGSTKKITKILTSIANVVISDKKDEGLVSEDAIAVKRDQTKSFWNYFWLCIKNGIVKTMI